MSSAEKLNKQSLFVSHSVGGPISAPLPLNQITAVLDAGTGTASWLREVAPLLPPTTELCGIDITDAKFPSPAPSGFRLEVHDITKELPETYRDRFDVINLRHVLGWIEVEQWDSIFRTLLKALKPGGYIQSLDTRMNLEADFTTYSPRMKTYVAVSSKAFGLYEDANQTRQNSVVLLPAQLASLGFTDISQTIHPLLYGKLQPDAELREIGMRQMLGSVRMHQKNGKGARPEGDETRDSVVVQGVTYVVPGNDAEWDAFIEQSEKAFEEEGWALPIRVTLARRPL